MTPDIFNIIKNNLNNLIIDDNDSSINYHTANIDNTAEYKPSLEELYQIYKNSGSDIFHYNTVDCITLILKSGRELSLHEYDKKSQVAFLKISNDLLKNKQAEIILSMKKRHAMPAVPVTYQKGDVSFHLAHLSYTRDDAFNDFNGYRNTAHVVYNVKNSPAINYCHNIAITNNGHVYSAYIPSAGQLKILFAYINMINYIITYFSLAGSNKIDLNTGLWWTSTLTIFDGTFILNNNAYVKSGKDDLFVRCGRDKKCNLLPFFKKIN